MMFKINTMCKFVYFSYLTNQNKITNIHGKKNTGTGTREPVHQPQYLQRYINHRYKNNNSMAIKTIDNGTRGKSNFN